MVDGQAPDSQISSSFVEEIDQLFVEEMMGGRCGFLKIRTVNLSAWLFLSFSRNSKSQSA